MKPSWADVSFSTPPEMATVPFQLAQSTGLPRLSQPEMETTTHEDTRAEPNSAYADPSIYSVARNDTASTTGNTIEDFGWLRTLQSASFAADSSLYGTPILDMDPVESVDYY
ncbi:hypothetical protein AAF712_016726 [Marasmius tenuissimus]|uniref:Uncharacterized protein n=1 Tax=Marasmius tenuissimus TaxID=585030 RepID=A0ABR2Z602_9AGAR